MSFTEVPICRERPVRGELSRNQQIHVRPPRTLERFETLRDSWRKALFDKQRAQFGQAEVTTIG